MIDAGGDFADGGSHQPLGIIHQVLIGAAHSIAAVAANQIEEAVSPNLCCSDLGVHVAHHEVSDANVIAHHMPNLIVAATLVYDLDRFELQPLRIGVNGIDDAAATRGVRADVKVMRGG